MTRLSSLPYPCNFARCFVKAAPLSQSQHLRRDGSCSSLSRSFSESCSSLCRNWLVDWLMTSIQYQRLSSILVCAETQDRDVCTHDTFLEIIEAKVIVPESKHESRALQRCLLQYCASLLLAYIPELLVLQPKILHFIHKFLLNFRD